MERMGLSTLISLVLLVNIYLVQCFNVDVNSPLIYSPDALGAAPSFFGYSVAISRGQHAVIVGAPKSNASQIPTAVGKERGAVYSCPVKADEAFSCSIINKADQLTSTGIREKQWMGATVYSDHSNIMSCAPRYTELSSVTGDYHLLGRCDFFNPNAPVGFEYEFNPCAQISSWLPEFEMCNAGLAAKIGKNEIETQLYLGTPSAQLSTGKIAISENDGRSEKLTPSTNLELSDYMGYAVTSGKFKKDGGVVIVGGAPRGNDLGGKVLMYDTTTSDYSLFSTSILSPSSQTGTYFGAALAAPDINNDKFADLVVGAPQYANTKPNQGAVYVYLNTGNDGLEYTKQVLYGTDADDFFGYSIGAVGDLNADSMPEVAIGAPWGGADKKGYVRLYYGTKSTKTPLVLKQIIKPSDINGGSALNGFGFSFAEYYPYYDRANKDYDANDLDNNNYNDLAIGSFKSGHVTFLRSRPVITIIGKLDVGAKEIDLYRTDANTICDINGKKYSCIKNVKVCFSVTQAKQANPTPRNVSYTVELDSENQIKRGFLLDGSNELSTLTSTLYDVSSTEKCSTDFNIYLKNNTNDILRAFAISLRWKYEEDRCKANEICPIASQMTALSTFKKIPYIKGCGSDHVCNASLSIKLDTNIPGKIIAIGITKNLTVEATIKNAEENAFINYLKIIYSPQVSPTKVTIKDYPGTVEWQPNVSGDSDVLTLGVTLSSPITPTKEEVVFVEFSVLNLGKGENVTFTGTVSTDVNERDKRDDTDSITLAVSLSANLTVSGSVFPENIKWKEGVTSTSKPGPRIKHTFYFQNMGPSSAEESDILIRFPEKMGNDYILNIISVELSPGIGVQGSIGLCNYGKLNPLDLDLTLNNDTRRRRRRREATDVASVSCDDGSPNCRAIECKLKRLGKSQSAVVIIESTLVEATFDKLKESRQIVTFAKFSSEFVKRPNGAPPDQINVYMNVNSPYLQVNKQAEPIEWWIILLCILGAIVIIGLIVFLLYKKGFFKRKKHGEEEEDALRKADPEDDFE